MRLLRIYGPGVALMLIGGAMVVFAQTVQWGTRRISDQNIRVAGAVVMFGGVGAVQLAVGRSRRR